MSEEQIDFAVHMWVWTMRLIMGLIVVVSWAYWLTLGYLAHLEKKKERKK